MTRKRRKRCRECFDLFFPDPRVKKQYTCSKPECQRMRKNRNQAQLRKRDKQHAQNDRDSGARFRKRNPGYWKEWRARNPAYVEKNRTQQRERNRQRREKLKRVKKHLRTVTPSSLPASKSPAICLEPPNPGGIATVIERSGFLLLNEEVRSTLKRDNEVAIQIAKVDVIYANPQQIQLIKSI